MYELSAGTPFGKYGDVADGGVVFGCLVCPKLREVLFVSSFVIARPFGTFPEGLAFLFLLRGPAGPEIEACRDRFRGVCDVEQACGAVYGGIEVRGNCCGKVCGKF